MGELAQAVQEVTGQSVKFAFVGQGYIEDAAAGQVKEQGMQLQMIKPPQAKRGLECATHCQAPQRFS